MFCFCLPPTNYCNDKFKQLISHERQLNCRPTPRINCIANWGKREYKKKKTNRRNFLICKSSSNQSDSISTFDENHETDTHLLTINNGMTLTHLRWFVAMSALNKWIQWKLSTPLFYTRFFFIEFNEGNQKEEKKNDVDSSSSGLFLT